MKAGLVGQGIAASLTPAMHEAEGKAQGLDYSYVRIDTSTSPYDGVPLAAIVDEAEQKGFAGLNVTHPFKVAAAALVDELSGAAAALGSINTIVFRGGKRFGHNTDYSGFRSALTRDLRGADFRQVLLVGAGGAGAAVALALVDQGVGSLLIHDKDSDRARTVARRILDERPRANVLALGSETALPFAGLDGVINATPLGMSAYPGVALDVLELPKSCWVADIVYFPLETALIAQARMCGLRVMSGAGMAVFQAVGSFGLFTGKAANAERMTEIFHRLQLERAS